MRILGYMLILAGYSYSFWRGEQNGTVFDAPVAVYPLAAMVWTLVLTAYVWAATKALNRKTTTLERLSVGGLTVLVVFSGLRFAYTLSADAGDNLVDLYGALLLMVGSLLVTYEFVSNGGSDWIENMARNLGSYPGFCLRRPPESLIDLSPGLLVILLISCFVLFGW